MIPYKGYVKANLTIPDFPWFNEDVSFTVVLDHKYGERVPLQIGTQVIDHLVVTMTKKELQQVGKIWNQLHLSTVIFKKEYHENV